MSDLVQVVEAVRRRFDALWIPEPMSGCWLWMGAHGTRGYGHFRCGGRVQMAHKVSLALAGRPVPDGLVARHRCDNPPCVNPDHLCAGTLVDNMGDMMRRGRHRTPRGSASPHARLVESQVLEIVAAVKGRTATFHDLAVKYRVHPSTIENIAHGRKWKHLTAVLDLKAVLP